jgi:hypothetical protein
MPTPVSVVSLPKVTASLKVCAPVVVMLPPLMAVVPVASVVRLLSFSPAVALPTAPPKVVVPLSLMVKLRLVPLDLTVLAKVTPTPVSVVFCAQGHRIIEGLRARGGDAAAVERGCARRIGGEAAELFTCGALPIAPPRWWCRCR